MCPLTSNDTTPFCYSGITGASGSEGRPGSVMDFGTNGEIYDYASYGGLNRRPRRFRRSVRFLTSCCVDSHWNFAYGFSYYYIGLAQEQLFHSHAKLHRHELVSYNNNAYTSTSCETFTLESSYDHSMHWYENRICYLG